MILMEIISSVLDIISVLCKCGGENLSYVCELKGNQDSLKTALEELSKAKDDVKVKVDYAENHSTEPMKRTNEVIGWLQSVNSIECEVAEILQKTDEQQISKARCFRGCSPRNFWTDYKLGKSAVQKLASVKELRSKGSFEDVACRLPPLSVQEVPIDSTVGMNSIFEKVWSSLVKDDVRVMGLYGQGGVGKTTLLKQINNEFLNTAHDFDIVILVVVSKLLNVEAIQKKIGERLGLSSSNDNNIFNALKKKKFVLLLDDLWQRIDLQSIGVPPLLNKSKVLFTTRSETVCGLMEANEKIRVECLPAEAAWSLFQEKAGKESLNSHPKVLKLAKVVAKECCGLPLTLITVGRAMSTKKTLQEWNHAFTTLRKSASKFPGMSDEVFPLLKLSYDSLHSETIKSCFLYCSLYPENHSIKKAHLINYWIGEGFLNGFDYIDEARNEGHDIIGSLKAACLLENGDDEETEVKMHDLIRELALWIVCDCGKKKDKFLAQTGLDFTQSCKFERWKDAERIHLMDNNIRELTEPPKCLDLITLIIRVNVRINRFNRLSISNNFFQFMPQLRVLNLSNVLTGELPTSITELAELQYLNLSGNFIPTLPCELKNLVKLKYLDLSGTVADSKIPSGVIACLPELQVLNLYKSGFGHWEFENDGASLIELDSLKNLNDLGITINTVLALQRLLSNQKLQMCTTRLSIWGCEYLTSLALSSSSSLLSSSLSPLSATPSVLSLGKLKSLRKLECYYCSDLKTISIDSISGFEDGENGLHYNLETLRLRNLPKLNIEWDRKMAFQCSFQNLHYILIMGCSTLKDLTWLVCAGNLKRLELYSCEGIEEIIADDEFQRNRDQNWMNMFKRLKTIVMGELPNLKSICKHSLALPSLETIKVRGCPQLKKLPLGSRGVISNTLQWIRGEAEWWDQLQWEDETTKFKLLPFFKSKYNERARMQGMVDEQMVEEEEERWIKHYSSRQKILLVGEGDFSFSVCLARAFASASNMIATSLDTREMVIAKYSKGAANLKELKELGCSIIHELSVHSMSQHPYLKNMRFDRILYNFPHAGFHHSYERCQNQINLHRDVVRGFFRNAHEMLSRNGEAHVTHKTSHPFSEWGIEKLAEECDLHLVEEVEFSRLDYPGYENKKGDGTNSDLSFPVGCCSTFKFSLTPLPRYDSDVYQSFSGEKISNDHAFRVHDHETKIYYATTLGSDKGNTRSTDGVLNRKKSCTCTCRKISQAKLRRAERRFRHLYPTSSDSEEGNSSSSDHEQQQQQLKSVSQYLNQGKRSRIKKIRPKWMLFSVFDM